MKSIPPHARRVKMLRNRIAIGIRTVPAMKRSIETGNLREVRRAREKRADRCKIIRLVKGRKRNVTFKMIENAGVDQNRPVVCRTAVHDPMAYSDRLKVLGITEP